MGQGTYEGAATHVEENAKSLGPLLGKKFVQSQSTVKLECRANQRGEGGIVGDRRI